MGRDWFWIRILICKEIEFWQFTIYEISCTTYLDTTTNQFWNYKVWFWTNNIICWMVFWQKTIIIQQTGIGKLVLIGQKIMKIQIPKLELVVWSCEQNKKMSTTKVLCDIAIGICIHKDQNTTTTWNFSTHYAILFTLSIKYLMCLLIGTIPFLQQT